jgi:hypothetical protein
LRYRINFDGKLIFEAIPDSLEELFDGAAQSRPNSNLSREGHTG